MMLLLILVATLLLVGWFYTKYHYAYWQRAGIPQDPYNQIPWGCLGDVARRKKSPGMCVYDVYRKSKERILGVYMIYRPALLIRDVQLVREVLIKEFGSFHDRGIYDGGDKDELNSNLFSQEGKRWKNMRTKLSPSFSSGKLKAMFTNSLDVAERLVDHLNTILPEQGYAKIDIEKFTRFYAIDIIASVIFGLEIDSFKDPNSKFTYVVGDITKNTWRNIVLGALSFLCPGLVNYVKALGIESNSIYELRKIVKGNIEQREKHNIIRKDILQLLMQLKHQGEVNADDNNWQVDYKQQKNVGIEEFSIDSITSQSFIFYIAGQETTAATSAFTLFEMAQNPEILAKAQAEVQQVLAANDNQINYETLQQMKYLELCMKGNLFAPSPTVLEI